MSKKEIKFGIVQTDKKGTITFLNPLAGRLLDINLKSLKDKSIYCMSDPVTLKPVFSPLIKKLKSQGDAFCETIVFNNNRIKVIGLYLDSRKQLLLEESKEDYNELKKLNKELIKINLSLESASEELKTELDMAKKIQESILPAELPYVEGYEFAVEYNPSGIVGGDFYDIERLDNDNLLILQADVSGHGIPAAFVTTMAKTYFDQRIKLDIELDKALTLVNNDFCKNIKTEHYMTAFVAVLNLPTGELNYCRICHPYPIVYRKFTDTIEFIKSRGGFFIGMMPGENTFYKEKTILNVGDKIIIYTDGLNEGFNAENLQYGRERLGVSVAKHSHLNADNFLKNIIADKNSFMNNKPNNDDISVLVIGRLKQKDYS